MLNAKQYESESIGDARGLKKMFDEIEAGKTSPKTSLWVGQSTGGEMVGLPREDLEDGARTGETGRIDYESDSEAGKEFRGAVEKSKRMLDTGFLGALSALDDTRYRVV